MTPPSHTPTSTRQPLAEAIAGLAATPDDVPGIDARLEELALLAVDRVAAADYAAVAARTPGRRYTVAASGELVETVENASSAALDGAPTTGDNAATTMSWPGFRETAADMGLGLLSLPLFAGSGATIATLDLYGRDAIAMAPLTAGICAAYDPDLPWPAHLREVRPLDAGGEELVAGFAEALSVRATIQLALELVGQQADAAGNAYLKLRLDAAAQGVPLLTAASAVIAQRLMGHAAQPPQ